MKSLLVCCQLMLVGLLLLQSSVNGSFVPAVPPVVTAPGTGVALAPAAPLPAVPVVRNYQPRVYVPVAVPSAAPVWPSVSYPTYSTYYRWGGSSYPYAYGYYPSYSYGYSTVW